MVKQYQYLLFLVMALMLTACGWKRDSKVSVASDDVSEAAANLSNSTSLFYLGANPDYVFMEPQFCFMNDHAYMTTHQGIVYKFTYAGVEVKRQSFLNHAPYSAGLACDEANDRILFAGDDEILIYDENLTYVSKLTSTTGKLAFDSSNRLWVYNGTDNNLYRVNMSTDAIEQTIDVSPLISTDFCAFAMGPDDHFYLANYRSSSATVYKVDSSLTVAWSVASNNRPFNLNYADGKVIVANYRGNQARVLDASDGSVLETFNGTTLWSRSERMYNATIAPNGSYWFGRYDGLYVFDSGQNLLNSTLYQGDDDYLWRTPEELDIDSEGNFYISEYGNHQIKKYNSSGEYLFKFGGPGSGDGDISYPVDLVVAENGKIYVLSWTNHRVAVFDSEGNWEFNFGSNGTNANEFKNPCGIAAGSNKLYVSEYGNHRVSVYDYDGNYLATIGSNGTNDGEFANPCGIIEDPITKDLYVGELGNNRIQKFDSSYNHVATFATGDADDNKNARGPWSLSLSSTKLFVASSSNHAAMAYNLSDLSHHTNYAEGWGASYSRLNSPFGIVYRNGVVYVMSAGSGNVKAFDVQTELPYRR